MRLRLLSGFLSVLLVGDLFSQGVPVGVIVPYAGNVAPETWLICDGSIITDYSNHDLYQLIGGWLPDLRGRFPYGVQAGDVQMVGGNWRYGGVSSVVLTVDQMPSHRHSIASTWGATAFGYAKAGTDVANGTDYTQWGSYVGGSTAHTNMPPYVVVKYIIKAWPDSTNNVTTNYYYPVTNSTLDDLNEVLVWRFKTSLWVFGGICALVCSVCFFARS